MRRFLQASWWIYSAKDRRGFSRNSLFFTAVLSGLIFGISACLGTDPASPAADHPQISPTTIKLPSTFTPAAAVESSVRFASSGLRKALSECFVRVPFIIQNVMEER